ncbi:DUF262 domain-containing protein [Micromonospora chokoriensis]
MQGDDRVLEKFKRAQASLVLQMSDLPLQAISSMVDAGAIDIQPKYQRRERWSVEKQSALIESFLINIPVPPVYLSEDEYGQYSVIDGKQRITAIHRFLSGGFSLTGLDTLQELTGRTFKQLPAELRQTLTVRPYLRVVTLLKQSDNELKYEVFRRLNTGGERLEPQEVRNVIFRGPINDLIYSLAERPFLKAQLKIVNNKSAAYASMTDAEYVLRFFALRESWNSFSGSLARTMDQFMQNKDGASVEERQALADAFLRSLLGCEMIWGSFAFKRPTGEETWRDQTIAGMYDAQMVAVDSLSEDELGNAITHRDQVIQKTQDEFLTDALLEKSVRVATNTTSSVKYRITKLQQILRSVS